MSETTTAPAPGTETTEPTTPQGDPADKPLGPNGEKALSDERAARKAAEKSAADLQAKLDAISRANLSDLEKAQQDAQAYRDQLAEVTRQNTVNKVALAKGVPADLVEFLTGETEDEISTKADVLLARLNTPTTPRPDPSQGSSGALALNGDGIESALKNALGIA